jgi:hypothetical protein
VVAVDAVNSVNAIVAVIEEIAIIKRENTLNDRTNFSPVMTAADRYI